MAIDWESVLRGLQANINTAQAGSDPMAGAFTDAARSRLNYAQNLQGAETDAAWTQALDAYLNDVFRQQDNASQRSWAQGQGKHVGNQAGRGLLGSSYDAQGRAELQGAREFSRQLAAQGVEQTRASALQERESEVRELLNSILYEDAGTSAAGGEQIDALANDGQAAAAAAGLNADLANANSQMWGNILTGLGEFGASGVRWADRENQANWTWNRANPGQKPRDTDNNWYRGW